eukprot:8093376-Alexandrium_andersonii.AAC.1
MDHAPVNLASASPSGGTSRKESPLAQVPSPPSKSRATRLFVEVTGNDQPRVAAQRDGQREGPERDLQPVSRGRSRGK